MQNINCTKLIESLNCLKEINDYELNDLAEHIISCENCFIALTLTLNLNVQSILDSPSRLLTKLWRLLSPMTCDECMELLPEYVEMEKDKAKNTLPMVWVHLMLCNNCKNHEEQLRKLEEELPELIGSRKIAEFPEFSWTDIPFYQEPKKKKFWELTKEGWLGEKMRIGLKGLEITAQGILQPINAFLELSLILASERLGTVLTRGDKTLGQEAEIQEIKIQLPDDAGSISVNSNPNTEQNKFSIQITPSITAAGSKNVRIGYCKSGDEVPAESHNILNKSCKTFLIPTGEYNFFVEWNGEKWELPIELPNLSKSLEVGEEQKK